MFERLRRAVSTRREVLFECRRCGTGLDGDHDCPACGSRDVARYDL